MTNFKELVKNRHQYAKDWKERTGGKILGYYETYFPEEVAYAAGILPVRLLAQAGPDDLSDKWMYGACFVSKALVNQTLQGAYDYLDGIVNVEGCQWMFHAFEVLRNNRPDLFEHYFFLPDYTDAPTSKEVTRSEMNVFKIKLEEWTGKEITNADLDRAIALYNENRRLLRRIYELRRANEQKILGSEAMYLLLASQVMDKADINPLLKEFLEEAEERRPLEDRVRLMLLGSETFDARLEELVESLGGNIVTDELDNGTSYCWNEVYEQKDRLMALALRYLGRPHNAIKDNNWRRRPQHIFELAEDFAADGVIIAKQINCHLCGSDNYAVWKLLRDKQIPFVYFERDMTLPPQDMKLRLEAFINLLKPGVTHLASWSGCETDTCSRQCGTCRK